jgi:glutaredoxin
VSAKYVDVRKDPEGMKEMLRLAKGERRVPVVVEQGVVTIGWGGGG